ncbi:hypothetical protein F5146DRAFT_1068881 [Armillaria mellea]|nr:hypothetical protein F5146DRAFT_1068881 [Armillaria mellea]
MHLALAIFLIGLVVFLHPLQEALSWTIRIGTLLVYAAYVTATILPMFFPQCPYRTPICDLIYLSFRRVVPEIIWVKDYFLDAWRRGSYNDMVHRLPNVKARSLKSLTMMESEVVQKMSTNLAAEALDWLFSASSNPSVQSIVIQSVGGLPMASNEMFGLQPSIQAARGVHMSLLRSCLQPDENQPNYDKPVPDMELKVERLLRFYSYHFRYIVPPDADSFELNAAIQSLDVPGLQARGRPAALLNSAAFFKDIVHPNHSVAKLPPISWSRLVVLAERDGVFSPLDPDSDNHANIFPLHLCSTVLRSFRASQRGLKQDLTSPLALEFKDALPYFPDRIYDDVLNMLSKFIKDPPLDRSSLHKSLRVFVGTTEFLLHRLSLPDSDIFHTIILTSLTAAVNWASSQKFSSQDATAVITVLEGILVVCATHERDPRNVCYNTIHAYWYSLAISPSACSLRGLQLMVDFMTVNWEQHPESNFYQSDIACWALADLLANRIPAVYVVFHETRCLDFFGSHAFHEASVRVISEYVAGISAMLRGRGGVMDATMLQQHVDRLHKPRHLFTVFLILATHSADAADQTVIRGDVTALMLLRPHDAGWDECCKKLHDMVDHDDADFFTQQRVPVSPSVNRELEVREIQIERDNIKFAIKLYDDFFADVCSPVPSDLPLARRSCIRYILGWCTGRQSEDKSDREEHV